ncbi:MAG: cell division protein FtsX [Campylobacter sp.]
MKSLKNHLSVILPMFALLFSVQFMFLVENIIKNYETQMSEDYNIIIVSDQELNASVIRPLVPTISSLDQLSSKGVLQRLSKDISAKNINILQGVLPKFYTLKLTTFPSAKQLENIKSKMLKFSGVSRVETFSKTHDKIYKILNLIKDIALIFSALMIVVGVMLLFKQVRIWLYEHKERIDIMTLFGAPFWLKSAVLYKLAIFDSLFAAVLVVGFYYVLPSLNLINIAEIGINLPSIDLAKEVPTIIAIALFLALISVSIVMRRAKRDNV